MPVDLNYKEVFVFGWFNFFIFGMLKIDGVPTNKVTMKNHMLLSMYLRALYLRANCKYKPPWGGLYSEGRFDGWFLHYDFGGLIFGGA